MTDREPGERSDGVEGGARLPAGEGQRLQKVLAAAGVASRRVSEQLIVEGRVEVNGRVVTELGSRIDPATDLVAVDGVAVQLDTAKRYYMLNKPRGVVSSMRDEQGRPDLTRFTKDLDERVYNVGRLDAETSGLLLLTNDGELAHVLAHPSFGVEKTYIAKVRGRVTPATLQRLKTASSSTTAPSTPTARGSCRRRVTRATRWWSSRCTPGGTASCGACSTRWGIRWSTSCGAASGRSTSAPCDRAPCAS